MRRVHVITDLQFGSTGKGLFAGWLARRIEADTVVSAFGPNAGHTFVWNDGEKSVHIMLPVSVVSPSIKQILIGPGSVIDPSRLIDELTSFGLLSQSDVQIGIHENAMVLQRRHADAEAQYGFAIGSTMKGTGEAMIDKIRRHSANVLAGKALRGTVLEGFLVGVEDYNAMMDKGKVIIVEGAQGFSLSINQGFYPYCTSRDCTTGQVLVDCAVPCEKGWGEFKVYGVARTYPIRVANRFAHDHTDPSKRIQIGTSGPGYWDQHEIQWEDINQLPEMTTVTKLPRRLFTFSGEQVKQAIRMNGVDEVFLNFCNYITDPLHLADIISKIEAAGARVGYTGWGPREKDVHIVHATPRSEVH